jgi:hypothetical protein
MAEQPTLLEHISDRLHQALLELDEARKQRDIWKANHDAQVKAKREGRAVMQAHYESELTALRTQVDELTRERDELHTVAMDFVAIHEAILSQGAHAPGSPQQITHWATHDLLKQTLGLPVERNPELVLEVLHKIIGGNVALEQGKVIHALTARAEAAEQKLATEDRLLRASVPERWKDCDSPVGSVQSYIAELEGQLATARQALERIAYKHPTGYCIEMNTHQLAYDALQSIKVLPGKDDKEAGV